MMEAREVPVCLLVLLFCAASCWLMASAVRVDRVWQARCRLERRAREIFPSRKFFPSAHMLEFPVTTHKRRTEAGTEADAFAAHTHTTGAAGGQHHTHTHLTSRKHTQNTHHTRSNPSTLVRAAPSGRRRRWFCRVVAAVFLVRSVRRRCAV